MKNKTGKRKTQEEFDLEIFNLVQDSYKFLDKYKTSKTKMKILHKFCQYEYETTPDHFINNHNRCPKCNTKERWTIERVVETLQKKFIGEYKLIKEEIFIKDKVKKIQIIHLNCGYIFEPSINNFFIKGSRCPSCNKNQRYTSSEYSKFIREKSEGEFSVLSDYINSKTKVEYYHNICNRTFKHLPSSFNHVLKCPLCKISRGEKIIESFLIKNDIVYEREYRIKECKNILPLPFDFAILDQNGILICLIEFDGEQHFNNSSYWNSEERLQKQLLRDEIKNKYCKDNNIPLLRIPYWDINNVVQLISSFFNEMEVD